ncbi:hypothetical protein [Mesorhizobium erdmanii]|uniref:hypothetical protein n=1 Tax=Mesorhizobium erdmanii TaxID=1777866 RepID=UPI00041477A8|nr:hypothetical protein [Mesorhizobium erdmanii]
MRKAVVVVALGGWTFAGCSLANAQDEFTPRQVFSALYEAMSTTLYPTSMPSDKWLSLSLVGAAAEEDDPAAVNDLANFCPKVLPGDADFVALRHLDNIYTGIVKGMIGPYRPESDEAKEARKFLTSPSGDDSPPYTVYKKFKNAYRQKLAAYMTETDENKRSLLLGDALDIQKDWSITGFRTEVDSAQNALIRDETKYGPTKTALRLDDLSWYKIKGLKQGDFLGGGAQKSPLTEFSPPVSEWKTETAWLSVSYSDKEFSHYYKEASRSNQGFGGISLGFVNLIATGGGGNGNVTKVDRVKTFQYSFDLKRVEIRRPWLDTDVFFEPSGWTWRKKAGTTEFPYVSVGTDAAGAPKEPQVSTYDHSGIACPLLPLELIIARKRSLVATVSKSDYTEVTTGGSNGGGGSLFGIFGGGGSRKWSTTEISQSGDDVTFKVEDPSIAVIGYISAVVPTAPVPSSTDQWTKDAWIEGKP